MQSTWNLRVLHNLLHCRVSSVHDNIDGTWRRSTFHELLSHRIRKVIHRNIAIVTLERYHFFHVISDSFMIFICTLV